MSSLVSLRSFQKRRKSAGARLERPLTSAGGSAEFRTAGCDKEVSAFADYREKRVKSARETRRAQESSDIFPELERAAVDPEWGKTKYSEDYCLKTVSPVHIRPISPTRMNNPHPSKEFMHWKHPTRIHEHKKATNPPPDIMRYIHERFYEDYLDKYNTGDAKNEVPITNLAKIRFPGNKEKDTPGLIRGISGKKAQLNTRQSPPHGSASTGANEGEVQRILRPPSPQSLMIHHTIKENTLPLFKEWLKSATTKEREVLLEMLQVAHDDSEEMRLSRVVNEVLQSDSVERVQEWLKTTNPTERQIVLHVLETLAVSTGEGPVHAPTYPALYPHLRHRHARHHTFPLSLQGHHSSFQGNSKHHHHHHHHHHHRSSAAKNKHPSAAESESTLESASLGLVGKKIVKPQRIYDENPALWQNRILRKKLGTSKVQAAGIFNQPKRDTGQHFSIHPEWPTA